MNLEKYKVKTMYNDKEDFHMGSGGKGGSGGGEDGKMAKMVRAVVVGFYYSFCSLSYSL